VAVLDAVVAKEPRVALCGHIHESWGERSEIGPTEVVNLGPAGTFLDA
jgi:Icc-related predicted phosphoesterase